MFQYRIYPTKKQASLLKLTLEECRWLYNETLAYRKNAWEQEQTSVDWYDSKARIPLLKQDRPSLKLVHSQVLQNVTERVELALRAFFRRIKAGDTPGYPRFKGEGRYDSFTYSQSGFALHKERLVLSKVGHIKIILHRPLRGKIKTLTIQRSATGKWYACFSVECDPERLPDVPSQVGIDVGLNTFAMLSTAEKIDNPRFFRQEEKALAKAQRHAAKEKECVSERKEKFKVVARVHERIGFRRDNFSHQKSRTIVDRFGVICVEDLYIKRMTRNHCLAKSIHDAAWSEFFSKLSYKAEEAGRKFVKVNPAYTSQTCSRCGHRQVMPLSKRLFTCPDCSLELDRDINASLNILSVGLHTLGIQPEEAPIFT